jgi:hypothetical protein
MGIRPKLERQGRVHVPVTTPSGAILAGGPFCFDHRFDGIHTAKIGLNYRFGQIGY